MSLLMSPALTPPRLKSATTATVHGAHSTEAAPDRGILRFAVEVSGSDPSALAGLLAQRTVEVDKIVKKRSARAETGSAHSWKIGTSPSDDDPDGRVDHFARVGYTVEFQDLEALGDVASQVAAHQAVALHGIDWRLHDESLLRREARKAAIIRARDVATDYAAALDLEVVRVMHVADVRGYGRLDECAGSGARSTDLRPPMTVTITESVEMTVELDTAQRSETSFTDSP